VTTQDWLILTSPAIAALLALCSYLPGASWPIDIATRGLEGDDPRVSASFALTLSSNFALTISTLATLLAVFARESRGSYQGIACFDLGVSLFVVIVILTRLFSLTAEQFDQRIWWGASPKQVAAVTTFIMAANILAVTIIGTQFRVDQGTP
jgi:hypothetical protein